MPDTIEQDTRESMFKKFGILSVPIAVMIPIGLFGHKPEQLAKGLALCLLFNSLFLINCILVYTAGICYLASNTDYMNVITLFYSCFLLKECSLFVS